MKTGTLVAAKDAGAGEVGLAEVGVVERSYREDGGIVMVPPMGENRKAHSFNWDELIELDDARELKRSPRARLDTPWGPLDVIATGGSGRYFGRDGTDKVVVTSPEDPEDDGRIRGYLPLVVNHVRYQLHTEVVRVEGEGWKTSGYHALHRIKGLSGTYCSNHEPTPAASKLLRDKLEPMIGEFLDTHPELLREAHRVVLWNEIAVIEGRIVAAKLHYEHAIEDREAALAKLEKREASDLGPFLLEVIGGGKA